MATPTDSPPQPLWIRRQFAPKTGRDHLGLNAVNSGDILSALSPSINVLTVHPRYHSFYCFVLKKYWESHPRVSRGTWKSFYRSSELAFSIAANLCDCEEHGEMTGIVGSAETAPLVHSGLTSFPLGMDYIKNAFGGYGLYYRSVMIEMGLVLPGGQGFPSPVDALTPEAGRPLADRFEEAVADTALVRDYLGHPELELPIDAAREFGRKACLCQLRTEGAADADLLRDVFLTQGRQPEARRESLRMFVDIASQSDGQPVSQEGFRRLLFYGLTHEGTTYAPSAACRAKAREWRLYQAREYFSFALNTLWRHFCEWGVDVADPIRGTSPALYRDHLETACDIGPLDQVLGLGVGAPSGGSPMGELLDWILTTNQSSRSSFDADSGLNSPLSEDCLIGLAGRTASASVGDVAAMLVVLAMMVLRFTEHAREPGPEWWVARQGGIGRISVDYFLRSVADRGLLDMSISEFAWWITDHFIIDQHLMVASGKLPENTFRFNFADDGLSFVDLYNPIRFNDARFAAVSTTAHELGLCGDLARPSHALTPAGLRLLETGRV